MQELIEHTRSDHDPVILTARVEGSDLVIRTLEIMPKNRRCPGGRRRALKDAAGGSLRLTVRATAAWPAPSFHVVSLSSVPNPASRRAVLRSRSITARSSSVFSSS